eukprot:366371-Chlamydomonas_euryale.AAC.20
MARCHARTAESSPRFQRCPPAALGAPAPKRGAAGATEAPLYHDSPPLHAPRPCLPACRLIAAPLLPSLETDLPQARIADHAAHNPADGKEEHTAAAAAAAAAAVAAADSEPESSMEDEAARMRVVRLVLSQLRQYRLELEQEEGWQAAEEAAQQLLEGLTDEEGEHGGEAMGRASRVPVTAGHEKTAPAFNRIGSNDGEVGHICTAHQGGGGLMRVQQSQSQSYREGVPVLDRSQRNCVRLGAGGTACLPSLAIPRRVPSAERIARQSPVKQNAQNRKAKRDHAQYIASPQPRPPDRGAGAENRGAAGTCFAVPH